MKRYIGLIIVLIFSLGLAHAESPDSHLCKMIKSINQLNYVDAYQEMLLVEDWPDDLDESCEHIQFGNLDLFQQYAYFKNVDTAIYNQFRLYVAHQVEYIGNILYYYDHDAATAEKNYHIALALKKEIVGENHPEYAKTLQLLGSLKTNLRQYDIAEEYQHQVENILKKDTARYFRQYATCLSALCAIYQQTGRLDEAESAISEVIGICNKYQSREQEFEMQYMRANAECLLGYCLLAKYDISAAEANFLHAWEFMKDHASMNSNLTHNLLMYLSHVYWMMADYDKGAYFVEQAYEIQKSYPIPLESRAQLLLTEGQFKKLASRHKEAEQCYLRALRLYEEAHQDASPDYIQTLVLQGENYSSMGNDSLAHECFWKAKTIYEKQSEEASPYNALLMMYVGLSYFANYHYDEALYYVKKAMQIYEDSHSQDRSIYLHMITELGSMFATKGELGQADYYFNLAEQELSQRTNRYPDQYAAENLTLIGMYHGLIGDYEKALAYYGEAFEINKKQAGDYHASNAVFIERVVDVLLHLEYFEEAERLVTMASEILENRPHSAGYDMAYIQNKMDLCTIYMRTNRIQQALTCALEIKEDIQEKQINQKLWVSTLNLTQLGHVYYALKEYDSAIACYSSSMRILEDLGYADKTSVYQEILLVLTSIYCMQNDYEKAEEIMRKVFAVAKAEYLKTTGFLSEKERTQIWNKFYEEIVVYSRAAALHSYKQNKIISTLSYDMELFSKGILLQSANAIRRSILESKDATLIQQWNELTSLRKAIHALQERSLSSSDISAYEKKAEQLEKSITRSSVVYRENLRQWNISWDSVRAVLKPRQVAIEFMSAPLNEDSTMYCALLLRDTCSYPLMIPLFEENQVAGLAGVSLASAIKQVYDYNGYGMQLSQIVWSKIQKYINRGDEVFFAPTGVLYQLAVENLPFDESHTMSDVYNMVRVSSTREIVLQPGKKKYKTAALYGDINYSLRDTSIMLANAERYRDIEKISIIDQSGDTIQRSYAQNLPGTKKEIDAIKPILDSMKIFTTVYTKDTACEESFKALSGKKQNILHVATHGFYWKHDTLKKNPLDRCGLLFAGANVAFGGHRNALPEGVDDGILTAKEISNLDFRTTDIVVLSACETGLGDITGDGVFGLQRAFKMAGAQTILMTLWKVDDDATQRLMTAFYRHLSSGQSKRQAFRNAQQEVRNYTVTETRTSAPTVTKTKSKDKTKSSTSETITTQPYSSPYFWAGFILLD